MDENLVGYLLKALDPVAERAVADQLETDSALRARCELLERGLAPLACDKEAPEPPPGLVLATLARIAEHRCHSLPPAPPPPRSQAGWSVRRWLRRPDAFAAAALVLLTAGLVLTAIVPLWRTYRRECCADNLRAFGTSLVGYSDNHNGAFPSLDSAGPRSHAGMLVPLLHDAGMLDLDHVCIACPTQPAPHAHCPSVSELERVYQNDRPAFHQTMQELAGNYAYSLGYLENGTHHGLRRSSEDTLPIMADRLQSLDQPNSLNHGGAGQNVLHVGGHVLWCTHRTAGIEGDDIYVNRHDQVRAGLDRLDTVLGSGDDSPSDPAD